MLKSHAFRKVIPGSFCSVLVFVLFFCSAPAHCETDISTGASIRTVGVYSDNPDFAPFYGAGNNADFSAQALVRVTAEGAISQRMSMQVHAVQSVTSTTAPAALSGSAAVGGSQPLGSYRSLDASLDWRNGRRTDASAWLDRFNIQIAHEDSDLTIGRQAITFGKAWFWNPLDVFYPFDPNQFDRDYKPGVDALRWDLALGSYSGFTLVAAAGQTRAAPLAAANAPHTLSADWDGSALIARWFSFINGWDVSMQGGKVYGGWQLGGGAVGEIGPYQLRLEGAQFYAKQSPAMPFPYTGDVLEDAFTGVVGIGRYYKSTLDLEFEYLYNGAGDPDNQDAAFIRQQFGASRHTGRHIAGISASYEFDPITHGRLTVLHSLSDQSTQVQPAATRSLSNNADLIAGLSANFGPKPQGANALMPGIRSEFGVYPNTLFVEWKKYF
jgi:hypothetical protein